jgi:hypothetical protein
VQSLELQRLKQIRAKVKDRARAHKSSSNDPNDLNHTTDDGDKHISVFKRIGKKLTSGLNSDNLAKAIDTQVGIAHSDARDSGLHKDTYVPNSIVNNMHHSSSNMMGRNNSNSRGDLHDGMSAFETLSMLSGAGGRLNPVQEEAGEDAIASMRLDNPASSSQQTYPQTPPSPHSPHSPHASHSPHSPHSQPSHTQPLSPHSPHNNNGNNSNSTSPFAHQLTTQLSQQAGSMSPTRLASSSAINGSFNHLFGTHIPHPSDYMVQSPSSHNVISRNNSNQGTPNKARMLGWNADSFHNSAHNSVSNFSTSFSTSFHTLNQTMNSNNTSFSDFNDLNAVNAAVTTNVPHQSHHLLRQSNANHRPHQPHQPQQPQQQQHLQHHTHQSVIHQHAQHAQQQQQLGIAHPQSHQAYHPPNVVELQQLGHSHQQQPQSHIQQPHAYTTPPTTTHGGGHGHSHGGHNHGGGTFLHHICAPIPSGDTDDTFASPLNNNNAMGFTGATVVKHLSRPSSGGSEVVSFKQITSSGKSLSESRQLDDYTL